MSITPPLPGEIANFSDMSIRDYFAGQALIGLLAGNGADGADNLHPSNRPMWAESAYAQADAMLAERAKGGA